MKLKAVFVLLCKRLHEVCLTERRRTATFPKHMWDMRRKKKKKNASWWVTGGLQFVSKIWKIPQMWFEPSKRSHSKCSRKCEEIHNWLRRSINRRRSSHGARGPYGAAHVFPAVYQGWERLLIQVSAELQRPRDGEVCVRALEAGCFECFHRLNVQCVRVNWRFSKTERDLCKLPHQIRGWGCWCQHTHTKTPPHKNTHTHTQSNYTHTLNVAQFPQSETHLS